MTADLSPIAHPINVTTLPDKGRVETLAPDADRRAALAKAHDLQAVERFSAELTIRRWQRDGVRVSGRIVADIVQTCVVSLEPVPARLEAPFEALFVPEQSRLARRMAEGEAHDIAIDPEGPDAPETFVPPDLDVGAVAEEFFALAIDPYPRAAEAQSPVQVGATDDDDEAAESPFAALAALRPRS